MDRYTGQTELKCNIVTSPSVRPQLFHELSRRPHIIESNQPTEQTFEPSDGSLETYRLGETKRHLSLSIKNLTAADKQFLDEIDRRHSKAYIYSSVPGSVLHNIPLLTGIGGDPSNAVYTGTLALGTTVYIPQSDTASNWYLEKVDYTLPVLVDQVRECLAELGCPTLSVEMPYGAGVMVLDPAKNWLQNTLFTASANWNISAGAIADRLLASGWMGTPAYWLWGTTVYIYSDTVTLTAINDGDILALSGGWKADGTIRVRVHFATGGAGTDVDYTYSDGQGYADEQVTVPAGGGGNAVHVEYQLTAGNYGEFCAPQLIVQVGAAYPRSCPVFIGSSGSGTQGEVTATSIKATGDYAPGLYGGDALLIASCMCAPVFTVTAAVIGKRIMTLNNSRNVHNIEIYWEYAAGAMYVYLYQTGAKRDEVEITDYAPGKIYRVMLYGGFISGSWEMGVKIKAVGGTITYEADYSAAGQDCIFNELYIGTDEASANGGDCVFSDVQVWTGTETMLDRALANLTVVDNLTEHREVHGRRYYISSDLSPSPWERGHYDGTITCTQEKVL